MTDEVTAPVGMPMYNPPFRPKGPKWAHPDQAKPLLKLFGSLMKTRGGKRGRKGGAKQPKTKVK